MYWLLSLLFFSVISISDTSINPAKDHLLIEHSVSSESAKDAVLKLVPDLMIGPGCKECTKREIEYCLSNYVIEDHCCCQRKYHEVFPYIAHTCYLRSRNCEPTVRDCGVFDRLLSCCCHHYLGMKWKSQVSTTSSINGQSGINKNIFIHGTIIAILLIKNYYSL